jgi:hypothetical protein
MTPTNDIEMLNIPFVREAVNKIILTNLEKYFNKYKLYDKVRLSMYTNIRRKVNTSSVVSTTLVL